MAGGLKIVGAGLPRTGTFSLRVALEQLLGGTCYHMSTLRERGSVDLPAFVDAAHGRPVDWDAVFVDCTAAVGVSTGVTNAAGATAGTRRIARVPEPTASFSGVVPAGLPSTRTVSPAVGDSITTEVLAGGAAEGRIARTVITTASTRQTSPSPITNSGVRAGRRATAASRCGDASSAFGISAGVVRDGTRSASAGSS